MEDRIEFDSVITEKALNDFKMYHVFHNAGGVFGYVFAAFAIVMCVLGVIFKMSQIYSHDGTLECFSSFIQLLI